MARPMVTFPARYQVQRIRRTQTGENALGQPIYTESTETVAVYSLQQTSEAERYTAALAGRTVTDLRMACPTGDFKPGDAVVFDGITYEVDGEVADHNTGWHGFKPGYSVNLRRVTDA